MNATLKRLAAASWLALGMTWAGGAEADAQETPGAREQPAARQVGCIRGRPLPACKSFWIFEAQGIAPLAQTTRTIVNDYGDGQVYTAEQTTFQNALEWNLGHMVNVGGGWALGGVLTVSTQGHDGFGGMRARARRWLTKDVSLEAEGGLMVVEAGGNYNGAYGTSADVRLDIRDQGSFFVRWDGVRLDPLNNGYGYIDPGGTQSALFIGAGVGSVPAMVATGVGGTVFLLLWAVLLAGGYD